MSHFDSERLGCQLVHGRFVSRVETIQFDQLLVRTVHPEYVVLEYAQTVRMMQSQIVAQDERSLLTPIVTRLDVVQM